MSQWQVPFGNERCMSFFRRCHSMWLFHLHSTVSIRPFSPVFLWFCHSIWLFLFYQYTENICFFRFSADGLHDWGILLGISLEFQEIKYQPFSMTQPFLLAESTVRALCWLLLWNFKEKSINYFLGHSHFLWLCLSLWLIQDSNWKGRVLWKWFGGLATILQNWISCNEQKMREAHITRRGTSFYLLIFIEKNHQP